MRLWLKASSLVILAPLALALGLFARPIALQNVQMPTLSVPQIFIESPVAMVAALVAPVLLANSFKQNDLLPLRRSRRLPVLIARALMPWVMLALTFAGCAIMGYYDVRSMTVIVDQLEYLAVLEVIALFRPQWAWSLGPVLLMFGEQFFGRFRAVWDWMTVIHEQVTALDWQIAGWSAGAAFALHLGFAFVRRSRFANGDL